MSSRRRLRGPPRERRAAFAALGLAAAVFLGGCEAEQDALGRGHALWADSAYADALAEYRLALARSGGRPEVMALVAHAFARTGDIRRARETYSDLLQQQPRYRDQAIFDFLAAARRSFARQDLHGMARAIEAATALRPAVWPRDLAAPLARYYARAGDPARALEFYEIALVHSPPDSAQELLFELGVLREDQGDCGGAVGYFDAYRARWPDAPRGDEVRWHLGSCAFRLAQEAHQGGRLTEALARIETVVDLGVPQNLQDQAWFERGEIYFALGQDDLALQAYQRVLDLNPVRTGQLVERAQRRIDQIRFGDVP